jgi:hypothetical protein
MKKKEGFFIAITLILFATLSRLVPHPMNFTPITAIILFSVFAFEGKWKFIIPLIAIVSSDLFLEFNSQNGFHSGTWLVYSAYAIMGVIGFFFVKNVKAVRVILCSMLASVSFFLLTNFALFYPQVTTATGLQGYPHTMAGIIGSYTAGIPFFRNMLLGDVLYTALVFGAYFLIKKAVLKPSLAK